MEKVENCEEKVNAMFCSKFNSNSNLLSTVNLSGINEAPFYFNGADFTEHSVSRGVVWCSDFFLHLLVCFYFTVFTTDLSIIYCTLMKPSKDIATKFKVSLKSV